VPQILSFVPFVTLLFDDIAPGDRFADRARAVVVGMESL
jgi:hypothetical protein